LKATPSGDFAPHHATEPRAIELAGTLIHGICEHGNRTEIAISPEEMPNSALRELLREILQSETVGTGWENVMISIIARNPDERGDRFRADLAEACSAPYAPEKATCQTARAFVLQHHRTRRKWELGQAIKAATETGQPAGKLAAELAELEAGGDDKNQSLRARAYQLRFDPSDTPPPDEACMMIGDVPIASRGNLTVIQGKSKVGKSAVVSAILAASQRGEFQATGDTLCIQWQGDAQGAIIHLDTEQSRADWHGLVSRSITRSGLPDVSPRFVSLPLVMFARSERLAILRETMEFEAKERGGVDCVIIDGIADLCISPNDEAEALELVSKVMALAQEFNAAIVCVLHENPGTDQGKTRGHLGSELNRKAFANLRIDKDSETSVSTIYGTEMRKREIPREQGFCFAWDIEAGMHLFQGRAAGLKAAQRDAKATAEARAIWEPIFGHAAAEMANSGTNEACPALTPKDAAELEREVSGTGELTKTGTMKKRMQRAETLGVLRKFDLLRWTLATAGQAGQQRDK
jgi:hypothetical protein